MALRPEEAAEVCLTIGRAANFRQVADLARGAAYLTANHPNPAARHDLGVPHTFFLSETHQELYVGVRPFVPREPGKLAEINIDNLDLIPSHEVVLKMLIEEIEPFIMGVGQVHVRETQKGFVIFLADIGAEEGAHNGPHGQR